ncbi:MAG: thioredoxin family protein [Alphaproteobacteria bacterium]|nr:thioredoxin family protein [Alphaproteobacteria bacterium]
MPELTTPICNFGWPAPDFSLPDVDGRDWSLRNCLGGRGLLVMFICNHCPYVIAIADRLAEDCRQLADAGVNSVAIMSNDAMTYPDDSFENMKLFAAKYRFSFPYLFDESQQTARAYDAVCTPDFFGFNGDLQLQYRGRFDSSGRGAKPNAERELLAAMLHVAETGQGPAQQNASIGCSLKWKA